jgi:hypothetical protein
LPDEQERVLRILEHVAPISAREKGLMNDVAFAMSPPRYDLEHITVPTLVMSAEDDLFGTYQGGTLYRGTYTAGLFRWIPNRRPQLRDPGDEMVLEAAVNGRANILVTFNVRDFGAVPARFGIRVMVPREAIERIRK